MKLRILFERGSLFFAGCSATAAAVLFAIGCSSWVEPIAAGAPLPPGSVYGSVGDLLAAHGCRQAVSLVGSSLTRAYTPWNPGVPLQGGAGFATSFQGRYGISFADRRSPVEVETLSEAFNALSAFLAQGNAAALGLPAGYQITEQDKADLFYVAGPGRGLAFREVLLPLIEPPAPIPGEPPVCPPLPPPCPPAKDCPACPACLDPVPLPCAPVPCSPVPCALTPLALSAKGRATIDAMVTWRTIGPGRRQMLRELAAEFKALQEEPPTPARTEGHR